MHAVACYEIDGSSHRAPLGSLAEQLYPEKNEVTQSCLLSHLPFSSGRWKRKPLVKIAAVLMALEEENIFFVLFP